MGGNVVRAGGAMLAALTITAGGMGLGVGTAGAAGSSDYLTPVCWGDPMPQGPCHHESFTSKATVGNTTVTYAGTDRARPGDSLSFRVTFSIGDTSLVDPVVIKSVTHHAPSGYRLLGASVRSSGDGFLDPFIAVDPVTGDVTLTVPDGGAAIPTYSENGTINSGDISVSLGYEVHSVDGDSTSGITFTGTDTPTTDGWVATADTRAFPKSMGSLDSYMGSLGNLGS